MSHDNNTGPSNVYDTADSSLDEENSPDGQVGQILTLAETSHQREDSTEDLEDSSEAEDTTDRRTLGSICLQTE